MRTRLFRSIAALGIVLGVFAAAPAAHAQLTVTGPFFDDTTRGDWRGTYGECFYMLPQANVEEVELPVGPDLFSTAPSQYVGTNCYGGPLFNVDPVLSNIDWSIHKLTNEPDGGVAYSWSYKNTDVLAGTAQWNPCLQAFADATWDNHRFDHDPLALDGFVGLGGDATFTYYFMNGKNECRELDFSFQIDDVEMAFGTVGDLAPGRYVSFDVSGLSPDAKVSLIVMDAAGTPTCATPGATTLGVNSVISGFFIDGTDACSGVEPECGDGVVDAGEQCDDGNTDDGDGCSADCTTESACGDGVVDAGEQCDDGNTDDGDGCSATCDVETVEGEGCTPGYWKQPQHFDDWTSFNPNQSYSSVFGRVIEVRLPARVRGASARGSRVSANTSPNSLTLGSSGSLGGANVTLQSSVIAATSGASQVVKSDPTLLEALNALGNDDEIGAFARHSVAALLNAASGGVNYANYPTVGSVINAVQAAIDAGTTEWQHNLFAASNEAGCPL